MSSMRPSPSGYAWEPTDEHVAASYGIPLERVLRFDLNTSPAPPPLAARILASGEFGRSVSDYPPSDYRRLAEAAAAVYAVEPSQVLVGAGADEVLDIVAKTWLPPGGTAVIPQPTYSMYRVLTEQRPARAVQVPRLGPASGHALDLEATRSAARGADLVWLCDPNNPTGRLEADGAIDALLEGLAADARADDRTPPVVVIDEAYAEFAGREQADLERGYPHLLLVRTLSKAYALAGIRVGFALGPRPLIAAMEPYRPPGSLAVPSVAIGAAALRDRQAMLANVALVSGERDRLATELSVMGWSVAPASTTNFVLVDLGSAERATAVVAGLGREGLVPRTFPGGHPLASHLRLTARGPADNERLLAAMRTLVTAEVLP
ncbi:MAG: histidinol-phosphate aminotransferase [Chloroflexi bacterium]|nr:histidinol-phosphate aminotransferase [Chloroflexota bacterium]